MKWTAQGTNRINSGKSYKNTDRGET